MLELCQRFPVEGDPVGSAVLDAVPQGRELQACQYFLARADDDLLVGVPDVQLPSNALERLYDLLTV